MRTYKKYPNFLKYFSLTLIGTSAGWVYYQVKRTQQILEGAVDTSVLNVKAVSIRERNELEPLIELEPYLPYERRGILKTACDSLKFAYARRLVRLASSNDKSYRIKAVKHLANVKDLDDWHCALLANMMDARTAVGLARIGQVDKRLLMDPPLRYHNYNRDMLINAVREFLIGLYEKSQHPCLGYFLSKVFVYEHDNSHIVDNDSSALELSKFIQSENDVLPKCLESLLHHASISKHTRDIVELNGLPLLMEIYHRYHTNTNIVMKLCRIISFMSFDKSLLGPLHKSGWIGILSEMLDHEDIQISIPAARALANLDIDSDISYAHCLYLLHPIRKPTKDPEIDVVFVHGLLGGVFYTWRQRAKNHGTLGFIGKNGKRESIQPDSGFSKRTEMKSRGFFEDLKDKLETEEICKDYEIVWHDIPINTDVTAQGPYTCPGNNYKDNQENCYTYCWPKDWLPKDCNDLRIIGINYDTSLSMWAQICPSEKFKLTLEERSNDLLDKLLQCGIGTKPIVWITHSMGGLIVKNILCKAFESTSNEIRNICLNTKGVVFYSTPHNGSRLACLNQATALLLWPSVEVQELRENSPQLKKIHNNFLNIVKAVPMKIITFAETKSTVVTALKFNFLLVDPKSGNPGIGEYFEIPQDHLGICKPLTSQSFLYQKVVHMIRDILQENKPVSNK